MIAAQELAANRSSGGEKKKYVLLVLHILYYYHYNFIVVLLNCLYLNPQVLPFVRSPGEKGRGEQVAV